MDIGWVSMGKQNVYDFYNELNDLYKYFRDYTLQEIYDSLIASSLFDLSNKEDLDFIESLAYKIYYGVQNYNRTHITWYEIGNALKSLYEVMGHKEKSVEYKPEYNFAGKTVKEVLDELGDEWRKK